MSRFVDPTLTRRVDLGECLCPGAPHEGGDFALVRAQLSAHEINLFSSADEEELAAVAARFIPSWNLLGNDGRAMPVSAEAVLALMPSTVDLLTDAIVETIKDSVTVPNGSGARSASTSPESAPPTPATPASL